MGFAMQAATEWKRGGGAHLGHLSYHDSSPTALGLGIIAPHPYFRVLFGRVQQCSILRDQTTWDLNPVISASPGHSSVGAPTPFLSAVHDRVFVCFLWSCFKGTRGLFGGGGR